MSGAEGWSVDEVTRGVLLHIESLGYVVSVHRLPASLFGGAPAALELHAVMIGSKPPIVHVARWVESSVGDEYRCACLLAEMAGVALEG